MAFHIIPVIDLLNGEVVRGVAGQRDQYRPVVSRLCSDPSPASVAQAFRGKFDFREVYVADLDAIGGRSFSLGAYQAIASAGMSMLLDAGVSDAPMAERCLRECDSLHVSARLVVGLESLRSLADLQEIAGVVPADEIVFSLDLKQGQPLTVAEDLNGMPPFEIVSHVVAAGVRNFIVLDLAGVGVGRGVSTLPLCREILRRHDGLLLFAGGGVRHQADLAKIKAAGCQGALVASALHDGTLTKSMIDDLCTTLPAS